MHPTSIPLVLSSLSFAVPYFAAIETGAPWSGIPWAALMVTSVFVHLTKRPYHLHGPGNCIPWLYAADIVMLHVATARGTYDAWFAGSISLFLTCIAILYANLIFYVGESAKRFVYDQHLDLSILSHVTVHLLAASSATAVIYARAFKNGQSLSDV